MFKITGIDNRVNDIVYRQFPEYERFQALQIGDYKLSARQADYNGWLLCDGRMLSQSSYPELYSVIGNDFGSAATGFFNIPDFTSQALGMFGLSNVSEEYTLRSRGDQVGEETHQLTVPELPSHSHTGTTDSSGLHYHDISNFPYGTQGVGGGGATACDETLQTKSTESAGAHTHTFTTNNTGNNDPHNNMQPTLFGMSVLIFSKFEDYRSLDPAPINNNLPVVP